MTILFFGSRVIADFHTLALLNRELLDFVLAENIKQENERYSWDRMTEHIDRLAAEIREAP